MTIPLQFASLYNGHEVFMWSDCLRGSADNELKIMSHQRIITYLISPNFLLMTAPTVEKADVVFSEAVLTTALVF